MGRTAVKRALQIGAGTVAALVALIGFAHTPAGRPLLRGLGGAAAAKAGCPLGYDRQMTAADREAERARFKATHLGAKMSLGHPALGFPLGTATRADVRAAAAQAGGTCRASKGMADLTCDGLPGAAGSRSLWFTFGAGGRLITVAAVSRGTNAQSVSAAFGQAKAALLEGAGQPSTLTGDASPTALAAGTLRQATAEFRFADYYAVARATNMGDGYLLTEEYRSLVD